MTTPRIHHSHSLSKFHRRTALFALFALMPPLVGCYDHDAADTSADAAGVDPVDPVAPVAPPAEKVVSEGIVLDSQDRVNEVNEPVSASLTVVGPQHGGTYIIKPIGNDSGYRSLRVTDGLWGSQVSQAWGDTHMDAHFHAYRNSDDGTWTFKDLMTRRCLDVSGYGTANATPVQVWTCHGGTNQRFNMRTFVLTPATATTPATYYYTFAPKHAPTKRLDVGGIGFNRLQIWDANTTNAQKMTFYRPAESECQWTVKVDNTTVTRTADARCRDLVTELADSTPNAPGGWSFWPAFFLSQSIGAVAGLTVGYLMTQSGVPFLIQNAYIAGECIWGGVAPAMHAWLQSGEWDLAHIRDGIAFCGAAIFTNVAFRALTTVPAVSAALERLTALGDGAAGVAAVNQAAATSGAGSAIDVLAGISSEISVRAGQPNGYFAGVSGGATDIGAGGNGSVWIIGTIPEAGGYGIYRHNGSGWTKVPGGAVRIAVGPDGEPWIVNSYGQIFQRTAGTWKLQPGGATDIGIGAEGSVWIIGTVAEYGGRGIYRWNGSGWDKMPGAAVRIAVSGTGKPWVVNSSGQIFRGTINAEWTQLPGAARDIGANNNGVWVIGTDSDLGGYGIHWFNGSSFTKVPNAGAVGITVNSAGYPAVVNSSGQIFFWKQT